MRSSNREGVRCLQVSYTKLSSIRRYTFAGCTGSPCQRQGADLKTRPLAASMRPPEAKMRSNRPGVKNIGNYIQFYTKPVLKLYHFAGCVLSPLRGGDLGVGQTCKRGPWPRACDRPEAKIRPSNREGARYLQVSYAKPSSIRRYTFAGCVLSPLRGGYLGVGQTCKRGPWPRACDRPKRRYGRATGKVQSRI